jgi:hypothetical protein
MLAFIKKVLENNISEEDMFPYFSSPASRRLEKSP